MWPEEIRAEVRSPRSILAEVAGSLTSRTRGLLRGEVRGQSDEKGRTILVFDIVVPALEDYRQRVLGIVYDQSQIYPVKIEAHAANPRNQADSDSELISLIQKINRSLVPTVQSLIARANDVLREREAETRLREIDDMIGEAGYRYDPLTGEIASVGGAEGENNLAHDSASFRSALPGVSPDEWGSYLQWKKDQAEEEFYQEKTESLVEDREDDAPTGG